MATSARRVPLASLQNATNSPHRALTNSGSKRPRALANVAQQENEPPQKRLHVDDASQTANAATPRRQTRPSVAEGRVFERGDGESNSTAFSRRLVAAREGRDRSAAAGLRVTKNVEYHQSKEESMRNWQKHYRKLFPTYHFYFDAVPEDSRARFVRQITSLHAHEEKFFSKSVTHIITTRHIPHDTARDGTDTGSALLSPVEEQPQTINPSLLERNPRGQVGGTLRRDGANHNDILVRGKDMGMKIWAAEKLQRVLSSILDDAGSHSHTTRGSHHAARAQQEDLSQVLKNEKLAATSDREQTFLSLAPFKGPFIYIHDMDEKYRPTMVREYPKVAVRTDGDWPQFRSAGIGKCPFVEDPATRREAEQERARAAKVLAAQQQREQHSLRTRSKVVDVEPKREQPARRVSPRKPLHINPSATNAVTDVEYSKPASKVQAPVAERQSSFPPMPPRPPFDFVRPTQLNLTREPAASGIQRSNVTSAIQSTMISSTAATGVKAATSKEVHQLSRKVLEKSCHTGSASVGSIPSSHRMTDLGAALKARVPPPQRAAKSRAQEKLGGIQEEGDPDADELAAERAAQKARRKTSSTKRDPKPGYCENCRDKYDDFEEHILSRKHRKFAMTASNWTELDALLSKLQY